MIESKVGAEPEKRIKHYFTKREGFHVGVSRDEWGCFRSRSYPYTFIGGYFFTYGDWWARRCSIEKVKEYWDRNGFGSAGNKDACIAVVDRNRKIAVIKQGCYYTWSLQSSLPDDFTVYHVNNIPCFDPCNPKNKKLLIKEVARTLIINYVNGIAQYYKVVNSRSKNCHDITDAENNHIKRISDLVEKYKFLPTKHSLFDKGKDYIYINGIKINLPTIDTILNHKIFTDEEKEHIAKCKFYTKYCWKNNINDYNWENVERNWNKVNDDGVLWQDSYIASYEYKIKDLQDRYNKARIKANENKAKAIRTFLINNGFDKNPIELWRKDFNALAYKSISYMDVIFRNNTITWFENHTSINCQIFDNVQLKLDTSHNNVITSRYASVPLNKAIKLFNILYIKYIATGNETFIDFTSKNIKLGYYQLRHIAYKEKYTDNAHIKLGYKEWLFQIGCHTLWFDDIKEFVKYYHLEDKVAFPTNISTEDAMKYNVVHCADDTITIK